MEKQGLNIPLNRLLNSKSFSVIELNNNRSPLFMELFSSTNDIFKDLEIKCKKFFN